MKSLIKKHSVPSGRYIVSYRKDEILEAYLGTCVGVALYDRKANVGGLLHTLLPKPAGMSVHGQPEYYAETGLPIFIRTLGDKGADLQKLEAVIAGGALVGPISMRDMDLDIGGHNVEIVERILKEQGIYIRKSETGGLFSCKLSLNLNTWESDIEPIGAPLKPETNDFERPTKDTLCSTIEALQPIPQIALKIIRMIHENSHSMEDLAKELRQDQVISAKVIQLCNSAFYNLRAGIDSIDRALVILGEIRLLKIIISALLEDFFSQHIGGYSLCKGGLFNHALGTAMMSEQLAAMTGIVSGDIAYTAGLLHDIGKVVLDQYLAQAYSYFYRKTQRENISLIDVEQDAFGVTHPETGGFLAERWSFPKNIMEVIQYHHAPEKALGYPELTHLIYLADVIMSRFIVGQELERMDMDSLKVRLEKIGLSVDQFPMMVEGIPRQLFGFN
jgi:putative nucleotidyltransferase with HDIG domain